MTINPLWRFGYLIYEDENYTCPTSNDGEVDGEYGTALKHTFPTLPAIVIYG
jgi:hypothetical protein